MDRRKEMEEYLKDYRTERLKIKKIYLENNLIKLESAFHEKLNILIAEQLQRQKEDNAVKLKNIFLCRLISSSYTESYETILGMSSVMLYMDEKKSQVYWYPELVYENIVQDMDAVEKLLRIKFLRLEDFERFFLKQKLLYDDWTLLQECFRNLFKQSVSLIMNSPLRLDNEVLILSGDYMDNLKIIDHKVTERREE